MTSSLKIVKATVENVPAIVDLWERYHSELKERGAFDCKLQVLVEDFRDSLEKHILSRDSLVILLRKGGKDGDDVGFSVSTILKPDWAKEPFGIIEAVYVLPNHRGQGAGREMKNTLERWLQLHVICQVELTLMPVIPGTEDVWKHYGYEPVEICMRKKLPRLK